ncbi:MAG: hypothetical protein AAFS10_25120 [Myxococcota bacterium]
MNAQETGSSEELPLAVRILGSITMGLLLLALVFGGLTCGVRVFVSEEIYQLWLYRNNIQEGDHTTYHDNGEVASIQPYSRGKINGEARYYDAQGRLTETVTYERGRRSGPYKLYYPNGQMKEQGRYLLGEKDTLTLQRFDTHGQPMRD